MLGIFNIGGFGGFSIRGKGLQGSWKLSPVKGGYPSQGVGVVIVAHACNSIATMRATRGLTWFPKALDITCLQEIPKGKRVADFGC